MSSKTRISLNSTSDSLNLIERAYEKHKIYLPKKIDTDPIYFPHLFRERMDIEVSAFIAAQFAYGNIRQMMGFLRELFLRMGESPLDYVLKGNFSNLSGIYYRFHKEEHIREFLSVLREILTSYGSIESFFLEIYDGFDTRKAIFSMREVLGLRGNSLIFFFPKVNESNPLKRWNLFLRWIVRKDEIDFGIWKVVDRSNLYVPLDTHLFKIGLCLGLTKRKRPDFKSCVDITSKLRELDPCDPVKYDFFLCHFVGIGKRCRGLRLSCEDRGCPLNG